jgi:CDP-diacylglycerol---serine O-phosphatidyltransferase
MRRIALLPNIITTGNMVCGLSAILLSMGGTNEDMHRACWLIMVAVLLDGLDGLMAVLTRSCTKFGLQYDSLADLISFGVAPALLLIGDFRLIEGQTARPTREYWAMCVILVVCVALRLARYNVQAGVSEKPCFQGLPCPSPAAFLALLMLSFWEYDFTIPPKGMMLVVVVLGILMVSNIPYPSIRKSDFFKTQPLSTFILVVLVFALIVMEPVGTMLLIMTGYILFGVVRRFLPNQFIEHLGHLVEQGKFSI